MAESDVESMAWEGQSIAYSLNVQKETQRLLRLNLYMMIFLILTILFCLILVYNNSWLGQMLTWWSQINVG